MSPGKGRRQSGLCRTRLCISSRETKTIGRMFEDFWQFLSLKTLTLCAIACRFRYKEYLLQITEMPAQSSLPLQHRHTSSGLEIPDPIWFWFHSNYHRANFFLQLLKELEEFSSLLGPDREGLWRGRSVVPALPCLRTSLAFLCMPLQVGLCQR